MARIPSSIRGVHSCSMGSVSGRGGPAPCPGEVTSRQNCDGPRPLEVGQASYEATEVGRAGAGYSRTIHRQGTLRAFFVMSHDRGEATNTNPASRSRTSHVKTHRFSSSS